MVADVPSRPPRGGVALVAVAVLVAVGTWLLVVHLSTAPVWVRLNERVLDEVRPGPPAARLMRGGLAYLAMPAVLLAGAVAAFDLGRRAPRAAVGLVLAAGATSVVVQGMKHGLLPTPQWLNPLSGHTALAAGVGLGWLAVWPGPAIGSSSRGMRSRRLAGRGAAAVLVGVAVAGVAAGNVLSGWHWAPQVLLPLGVAAAAALVVRAWLGPVRVAPGARRAAAVTLVAGGLLAAMGLLLGERATPAQPLAEQVLAAVLVVLGAVVVLTAVVAAVGSAGERDGAVRGVGGRT